MGKRGKRKKGKKQTREEKLKSLESIAIGAIKTETDRVAPLVAAELLSNSLELLLRNKFDKESLNNGQQNRLIEGWNSPLASFGMRISICDAFGLLPSHTCAVLNAIRAVRNHCAHFPEQVSFNDAKIANEMNVIRDFVARRFGEFDSDRHFIEMAVGMLFIDVIRCTAVIRSSRPAPLDSYAPPIGPTPVMGQSD